MNTDYLKWGAIAIIVYILWKNSAQYISDVSTAAQRTYHAKENFGR